MNTRVLDVVREGHDSMKEWMRKDAPFMVRVAGPGGEERRARTSRENRLRPLPIGSVFSCAAARRNSPPFTRSC